MSAHTPGPSESGREYAERIKARDDAADQRWTSGESRIMDGKAVSANNPTLGCGCNITKGAQVYFWHHCSLHAAAPEMLEALERIITTHDASCAGPECGIAGIDKARAVIAKAKGESK